MLQSKTWWATFAAALSSALLRENGYDRPALALAVLAFGGCIWCAVKLSKEDR